MDDNKKNGFDEKQSYYYSYGPYKSGSEHDSEGDASQTTFVTPSGERDRVEVAPPNPVRPFTLEQGQKGDWQYGKKKSSGLKSAFSAFLAGALVVGGLMFAADKTNLFTGDGGVFANTPSTAAQAAPSSTGSGTGSSNGVKTVADIARPNNISEIFQNASPAVVKIETKVKSSQSSGGGGGSSLFDDPFFRQFFGDNGGGSPQQPQPKGDQLMPSGMGTGFIFEKSGYILTNEHVIDGADEINVTIQGYDKPFKAKLLGNSYDLDLAALKIEGDKDFPTLPIGNADNTKPGDWVVAIGNPYGFDHTVTVGVLSAKERPISIPDNKGTRNYKHLLQTDASINPGNSGGPLLNLNGEVIGINTAVNAQAQGIGFAIPTNTFSAVLDNLKNNVKIPKEPAPYIGVVLAELTPDLVPDLKLSGTDGALVQQVERKSPAFKAGLKTYDVIVDINGTKVKTYTELVTKVKSMKVGDKVTLGVMRDGKRIDVPLTIEDRNNQQQTPQQ